MTKQPVRLGFVGAGFFGQVAHLRHFAQVEGCRIVALAEIRDDLRRKVAERFGIPFQFQNHLEMLNEAALDAVVVVTARSVMGPIVLDCLRAGKHVLSEKPIAGNSELAATLVDMARQNNVQFSVGYMKRHDEGVQAAKAALERILVTQELGALTYVRAHCFAGDAYCGESDYERSEYPLPTGIPQWPTAPPWIPLHQQAAFDRYLNTYCHDINLIRYLVGHPIVHNSYLQGDIGIALLKCQELPALLETGLMEHSGWDEHLQIFFERGWIRIRTPAPLSRDTPAVVEIYRGIGSRIEQLALPASSAFRRQAEAFIADVQSGKPRQDSAYDAQLDVELVEEIWRKSSQSFRL